MRIDSTQLNAFLACPERYRLRYREQIRRIKEEDVSLPLRWGQAFHAALATHYTKGSDEESYDAFKKDYMREVPKNEALYTQENGIECLKQYLPYARQQHKRWKVLQVEPVVELQLNPSLTWFIKPDLIMQDDGGIWAVEHKTTRKPLIDSYWRQFEPNLQLTGQAAYVQEQYGQCAGIRVNAINIGYRKRAYRGEAPGFHCEFSYNIFNRTPRQVEDWKENVGQAVSKLEREITYSRPQWVKNEASCTYCEFRDLCISTGDEQVKEALYESYDAYAYLKEKEVSV